MKKIILSAAFIALACAAGAQTDRASRSATQQKSDAPQMQNGTDAAPRVRDDGTAITPLTPQQQPAKTEEPKKERDRMAISEKGVPASKDQHATKTQSKPAATQRQQPAPQPK